jgi:hypothetical protein
MATPEDKEEKKFQAGIKATPWFSEFKKRYGEDPDLSSSADYDYRKAWKAGIRPQPDPNDNNRYHWSSSTDTGELLKGPNHPTLWKENYMRATGKNPDATGVTEKAAKKMGYKKGGLVKSSVSSRGDGAAKRGKTKGRTV